MTAPEGKVCLHVQSCRKATIVHTLGIRIWMHQDIALVVATFVLQLAVKLQTKKNHHELMNFKRFTMQDGRTYPKSKTCKLVIARSWNHRSSENLGPPTMSTTLH
eukprot:6462741-Amphidinium_carterae.1